MKSNRTAVKALRSGCGKCSERGLGPCADGIAAAKKKMEARGPGGRAGGRTGFGFFVFWFWVFFFFFFGLGAGWGGGGSFGRIAAGTWDGLLRELVPGCRGGFRAVTPRCQQASCCVCGVRAGEKWEPGCEAAFSGRQPRARGCFRTAGLRDCAVGVARGKRRRGMKGPAGAGGSAGTAGTIGAVAPLRAQGGVFPGGS